MNLETDIIELMHAEAEMNEIILEQALTRDTVMLDSGLDSLCLATVVVILEQTHGVDPFTSRDEAYYPVTVGDFVDVYVEALALKSTDAGQPGTAN